MQLLPFFLLLQSLLELKYPYCMWLHVQQFGSYEKQLCLTTMHFVFYPTRFWNRFKSPKIVKSWQPRKKQTVSQNVAIFTLINQLVGVNITKRLVTLCKVHIYKNKRVLCKCRRVSTLSCQSSHLRESAGLIVPPARCSCIETLSALNL